MRTALILLATASLTGCISLISPATKLPPRYTLTAQEVSAQGPKYPVTLAIADARVEGALNTSKIAVRTAPNELRYLSEGDWSDRAPLLFSLLLERSFEERSQLLAVSDRVALPIANYTVFADISEMNLDRTGAQPLGKVTFRVRIQSGGGRVLGTEGFEATRVVSGDTTRDAATAINDAAAEATRDAVTWAMGVIAADQAGS
ncbi:MAG: membrane integrity-associated transporter subunit PqiC [Parvularculaceae bacterium]|nr:membrane integrity-associated transporter subunit PqiC [Parvularculaceae bacterium]